MNNIDPQQPQFVIYPIYERDMERINGILDKLIEYTHMLQVEQAKRAAIDNEKEKTQESHFRVKLLVGAAFLAMIGSMILDAVIHLWQ